MTRPRQIHDRSRLRVGTDVADDRFGCKRARVRDGAAEFLGGFRALVGEGHSTYRPATAKLLELRFGKRTDDRGRNLALGGFAPRRVLPIGLELLIETSRHELVSLRFRHAQSVGVPSLGLARFEGLAR